VRRASWSRVIAAVLVGWFVAVTSLTLLFGNPVTERLLFTGAAGQSEKVLSVWLEQEPLPAVTPLWSDLGDIQARGLAVQAMLLLWMVGVVIVYALGWANRPGPVWRRGATFGITMWLVVFVFFEAWVPFNVLGEPFRFVALQLALQLVAMTATGMAVAALYSSRPASGIRTN
jgi:hypothetical protein